MAILRIVFIPIWSLWIKYYVFSVELIFYLCQEPDGFGYLYTIRANSSNPVKKQICLDLKALYDASKKYHHGAEDGSLLGISWVNPNEEEYFDEVIQKIIADIRSNGMVRELSA